MSEKEPKQEQLNLPFEQARIDRLREMMKEPVSDEERAKVHTGMELYIPPELEELFDLPKVLRERVNGVVKVTDAQPHENMVGIQISKRITPDISEEMLHELLARPFNGGLTVEGKEIVLVRQATATATRDIVALLLKVSEEAKKLPKE